MKKIIDGKLYDTEKSEIIIEFYRLMDVTSVLGTYKNWVEGELHKTKNGNWFEVIGRNRNGTQLNKLSEEDAKLIIKSAKPDLYIEMYGDVEEA